MTTSDKSKRFVVLLEEQYRQSGLKHTKEDVEIGPGEVAKFQNVLNTHTRWFNNIFGVGEDWNHTERMNKNVCEKGEQTCPMFCLIKDHKAWSFKESDPTPPSRPVIAGNLGINRNLSELISLVIEPITLNMDGAAFESTQDIWAPHASCVRYRQQLHIWRIFRVNLPFCL